MNKQSTKENAKGLDTLINIKEIQKEQKKGREEGKK
jgi:hypothetical protein